jgi:hypothetical protein
MAENLGVVVVVVVWLVGVGVLTWHSSSLRRGLERDIHARVAARKAAPQSSPRVVESVGAPKQDDSLPDA